MKEIKIEKCQYCGGTKFIECRMYAYGGVYVIKKIHSAVIYTLVCRDCGSIVRSYVSDAEKLLPKKERKSKKLLPKKEQRNK